MNPPSVFRGQPNGFCAICNSLAKVPFPPVRNTANNTPSHTLGDPDSLGVIGDGLVIVTFSFVGDAAEVISYGIRRLCYQRPDGSGFAMPGEWALAAMLRTDLGAARQGRLKATDSPAERLLREHSDFLMATNAAGEGAGIFIR